MEQNFNPLVRIASVDLDGKKQIYYALPRIRGVSFALANAVLNSLDIDKSTKTGYLEQKDIDKLSKALENVGAIGLPLWLFNRRNDMATGEDKHMVGPDLKFAVMNDIRRLQRIKGNRGFRHTWKLPVRGQRTRGNFRKGASLGVQRKKAAPAKKKTGAKKPAGGGKKK